MSTEDLSNKSLLEFPCKFPIKVFGPATEEFEIIVLTIIRRYVENLAEDAIQTRKSNGGKYYAITITIDAESQTQLDAIYTELSASEHVVMAL